MITETEMPYEEMQRVVNQGYLCAECQSILTIAWGGAYGISSCVLRCGKEATHKGITRHDKKYEQEIKEGFSMNSNALMTMGEAAMLKRVEMARFPQQLTVADMKLLAQVAITYGFDPLMSEVTIYQGRPFVSIDGRYRKAQETNRLDGAESRPATKKEREDWQIPEGDYFFRAEVYVKDASHAFVGWGRVRVSETKPGSTKQGDTTSTYKPIQSNPQRMAEKRAEAMALRKAFHIPLPSVEDIGSPDFDIESTAVDVTPGELTKPEPSLETPPEPPKSKSSPVAEEINHNLPKEAVETAPQKNSVDPEWLEETLGIIHWKETTALSWIKMQLKVPVEGNLTDMLNSLGKDKLEVFVKHISGMREAAGR